MSKNLTRKGLAFGAIVALGTSMLAATPAHAASVLFAPTTGTGNTLVAGETFSLTASLSSDLPASNATQLKFKVANTTGVAATVTINGNTISAVAAAATRVAGYGPVALDASVGGTTAASTLAAATTSAVYGLGPAFAADAAVVAGASTATNPTTIAIASTAATTANYTVTAWLDSNNNGLADSGELSAEQTVKFVKIADSGVTTNFTKPTLADANNVATISFGSDVNVAQLSASKYAIAFGAYVANGKAAGAAGHNFTATTIAGAGVSYDSTNKVLKLAATTAAAPAFAAGETRSAQAVYNNAGVSTVATNALVGTEATQVVGAAEANSVTALAPVISDDAILDSGTSFKIRSGVAATSVVATVKKNTSSTDATQIAVGAGVVVKVTVSGLNLATASGATSADTLSVNGVAVTSANVATYSTTATTDAAGKVSIPVVTSAGTAGDAITVTITATNASSVTASATLTWTAATLSAVTDLITGSNTPVHTAVKGGAYSAKYALTDSYNALVKTADTYRLVFTAPGAGTSPTSQTIYANFVDGVATVSLTDNSTGAGSNAASYIVEKKTNGLWAQAAAPNNATVNAPFTVTATAPVASAVSAAAVTSSNTSLELATTFATVDRRTAYNSATVPSGFSGTSNAGVTGQVTDAQGVGIAGATVTIAAPGVQFISGNVYSVGSITVVANNVGTYTVDTYSHTAGAVVYTVTSGAATKTLSITYVAAADTTATSLVITAPASQASGRTFQVTALLTDKFGNPVATTGVNTTADTGADVSVSYAGPGIVSGSLPTKFDSKGSISFYVLLGADEVGTGTVTVKYDQTGADLDYTDATDIVKTATIAIAPAAAVEPVSKIGTANGRVYVNVKDAKGAVVTVKIGSKWTTKTALNNDYTFSFKNTKGKKVAVKVYVDGDLSAAKTITVK